ncbi:hypothetical protein MHTCC0001_24110 [Flavobacteriaceae bacterium MHTCC 0001]
MIILKFLEKTDYLSITYGVIKDFYIIGNSKILKMARVGGVLYGIGSNYWVTRLFFKAQIKRPLLHLLSQPFYCPIYKFVASFFC